ncbi:MAG: hypothetical protein VX252_06345 [Myxococcota bacterium]|nr:hypothetical protein [Myxococcota bacterium]
MSMPSAEGIQNPELKVYEKRGKLRGWLKGKRGKMRLKKIAAEGDQFTFVQVIPMGSEELKLTFQGTVRGDHIQGVMTSKKLPKLPFSGVRKPSED